MARMSRTTTTRRIMISVIAPSNGLPRGVGAARPARPSTRASPEYCEHLDLLRGRPPDVFVADRLITDCVGALWPLSCTSRSLPSVSGQDPGQGSAATGRAGACDTGPAR